MVDKNPDVLVPSLASALLDEGAILYENRK